MEAIQDPRGIRVSPQAGSSNKNLPAGNASAAQLLQRMSTAFLVNALSVPLLGAVNLATTAVVARYLGLALYGTYAILLAAVSTLTVVLDFGIESSLQKIYPLAAAEVPGTLASYVRKFALVRLATFAGLVFVALAAPKLLSFTALNGIGARWVFPVVILTGAALIQGPFSQLLYAFFKRFCTAAICTAAATVQLGMSAAAVIGGFGLAGVITAQLITAILSLGAYWVFAVRELRCAEASGSTAVVNQPAAGRMPATLRDCMTIYVEKMSKYFAGAAFGILLTGSLLSRRDAALFAIATQLTARFVTVIHAPLNGLIVPLFAHTTASGDEQRMAATYARICRVLILLLIPLGCALIGCAPQVLELLYGAGFKAATLPFQLVVISMFAEAILYSSAWNYLFVKGIPKLLQLSRAILIIGTPPSALLGAKFGIIGPVVCTRVPSLLSILVLMLAVRRAVSITLPWRFLGRVSIPGVVAAGVGWGCAISTGAGALSMFILYWITFPIVFGVGFHFMGGLDPADRALLKRISRGPFQGAVNWFWQLRTAVFG